VIFTHHCCHYGVILYADGSIVFSILVIQCPVSSASLASWSQLRPNLANYFSITFDDRVAECQQLARLSARPARGNDAGIPIGRRKLIKLICALVSAVIYRIKTGHNSQRCCDNSARLGCMHCTSLSNNWSSAAMSATLWRTGEPVHFPDGRSLHSFILYAALFRPNTKIDITLYPSTKSIYFVTVAPYQCTVTVFLREETRLSHRNLRDAACYLENNSLCLKPSNN